MAAALPVPPGGNVDDAATDDYTVDEIARRTGTTVRTIRWYQSEGLLAAPRHEGRVARYDAEHLVRLEAIRDLQAHGLTLIAIRRLLDRAPDAAATRALAFVQAAVTPHERVSEVVPAAEGAARLGVRPTPRTTGQLVELGIVRELPGDRWQIVAPAVFRAAVELAALGVPLAERLRVTALLREHTEAMARAVVDLFVEHLWRPTQADGDPADPATWDALEQALDRLRPLATTSVVAYFDAALARAAEAATEHELTAPGDVGTAGGRATASAASRPAPTGSGGPSRRSRRS